MQSYLVQERRELFYDLLVEGLEDWALVNAIKEGEAGEAGSRPKFEHALAKVAKRAPARSDRLPQPRKD